MAPRLSWSNLLPGLIALSAVLLIAAGVLVFAGVGRVRGQTIRLYVRADQARGLMKGSEVWLEGQKVGVVDHVGFLSPDHDSARVVIAITIRERDADQIRRDSPIAVRPGANFVGPIVVYVSAGTPGSPRARHGDTLLSRPQSDLPPVAPRLDSAMRQLAPIMADARAVMAHTRNASGTLGAARVERGGGHWSQLRVNFARARSRVAGLAGQHNGDHENGASPQTVMRQARGALARADSIQTLLRSPRTSLGRFRRDTSLSIRVASVREELRHLRARLDDPGPDGTLGRFAGDSAIAAAVATAQRQMTLLFEDLKRRPLRYIAF